MGAYQLNNQVQSLNKSQGNICTARIRMIRKADVPPEN